MAAQVICPECKRRMKAHCRDWKCRWAWCLYCSLALDLKSGRWIGSGVDGGK